MPTETYRTPVQGTAPNAKDCQLRDQNAAIARLITARNFDAALQAQAELEAKYEQDFNPSLHQYTFQSQAEFEDFQQTWRDKFEWIDWGYALGLKAKAYVLSERGDFDAAVAALRKVEKAAPMFAEVLTEEGFACNRLGRFPAAVEVYQRALALTAKYQSQHYLRALTLRGLGFALGEMGRWDEAESAYRESLTLETGNKLALNELRYLQHQRAAK